jgi:hypothetical protein
MVAKLTRLTHKIAMQLYLVVKSCTICSSRSRRPVRKLLDTLSYNVNDCGVFTFITHYRTSHSLHSMVWYVLLSYMCCVAYKLRPNSCSLFPRRPYVYEQVLLLCHLTGSSLVRLSAEPTLLSSVLH